MSILFALVSLLSVRSEGFWPVCVCVCVCVWLDAQIQNFDGPKLPKKWFDFYSNWVFGQARSLCRTQTEADTSCCLLRAVSGLSALCVCVCVWVLMLIQTDLCNFKISEYKGSCSLPAFTNNTDARNPLQLQFLQLVMWHTNMQNKARTVWLFMLTLLTINPL